MTRCSPRDWVASRQQRRHLSVARAPRASSASKGSSRPESTRLWSPVDADGEFASALALAQRKAAAMAGLALDVRYRRLAGLLARRGFGSGMTSQVLAEVLGRGLTIARGRGCGRGPRAAGLCPQRMLDRNQGRDIPCKNEVQQRMYDMNRPPRSTLGLPKS